MPRIVTFLCSSRLDNNEITFAPKLTMIFFKPNQESQHTPSDHELYDDC